MSVYKYTALSSPVVLLNSDSTSPTMKGLASNGLALSGEYDNPGSSNRNRFAQFEALARYSVAPAASGVINCWFICAIDGTNYEDGDASTAPARPADFIFNVRAVTTQQRLGLRLPPIQLPSSKFKVLVQNAGGQALTNTDGENGLRMLIVNEESI